MRGIEVYVDEDEDILGFNEDGDTTFQLNLKALKDNEGLKNEVLAYIKRKFDSFFNELKTALEKSKEEEASEE